MKISQVARRALVEFARDFCSDQARESFARFFSVLKSATGFGDARWLLEVTVDEDSAYLTRAANAGLDFSGVVALAGFFMIVEPL